MLFLTNLNSLTHLIVQAESHSEAIYNKFGLIRKQQYICICTFHIYNLIRLTDELVRHYPGASACCCLLLPCCLESGIQAYQTARLRLLYVITFINLSIFLDIWLELLYLFLLLERKGASQLRGFDVICLWQLWTILLNLMPGISATTHKWSIPLGETAHWSNKRNWNTVITCLL